MTEAKLMKIYDKYLDADVDDVLYNSNIVQLFGDNDSCYEVEYYEEYVDEIIDEKAFKGDYIQCLINCNVFLESEERLRSILTVEILNGKVINLYFHDVVDTISKTGKNSIAFIKAIEDEFTKTE